MIPRGDLWRAAGVMAVLGCAIAGSVAVEAWRHRRDDPLTHPEYITLMREVVEQPADTARRERLRVLDRDLRTAYVARGERLRRGGWVIAGLGALAVVAAALAMAGRVDPHDPRQRPAPDPWRSAAAARLGLAGAAVLLAGGWASLGLGAPAPPEQPPAPAGPPSEQEFAANWPCFRGPHGDGSVSAPWPGQRRERWRVPAGLPGRSSPVVWGDAIFVSGADANRQTVTAFATDTGAVRWTAEVPWPSGPRPQPFEDTGFAAPTPVTDGRVVAAVFASGAAVAIGCGDGKLSWQKQLGAPDSMYSYAASPAVWRDRMIVQWDVDDEGKSALLAWDLATGRELWRTRRELGASWCSPVVARQAEREVVLAAGNPRLAAYDPADGRELWHADLFHGDVGPSPIIADGRAIFANFNNALVALGADGKELWKGEEGLPDTVSPASDGRQVALIDAGGMLSAFALAGGAKAWEQDLHGSFKASPLVHGSELLVVSTEGQACTVGLGPACVLGEPWPVGGPVSASPALVGGRLYIRTETELVCYEAAP